jgi:hypothetical protein
MKVTTHLHLVLMLRIHGTIPPLLQHTFMAWCSIKQWIQLYGMELSHAQGQFYILNLHLPLPLPLPLPCTMGELGYLSGIALS